MHTVHGGTESRDEIFEFAKHATQTQRRLLCYIHTVRVNREHLAQIPFTREDPSGSKHERLPSLNRIC
jgi:hypothetical protein